MMKGKKDMLTLEFRKAITEVVDILEHMEEKYTDKVPQKFKDFLQKNKLNTYKPNLNHCDKLSEIPLTKDAKNILGIIYLKYWKL